MDGLSLSLGEDAFNKALEAYCEGFKDEPGENGDSKRTKTDHLNVIVLNIHRGDFVDYTTLISKYLGPYLTNENSYIRARSTLLLAELLERLPDLPMNEKMLKSLVTFFVERMKSDYDSSPACLLALKSVMQNKSRKELLLQLAKTDSMNVIEYMMSTMLTAHHVPALGQSYRYKIYDNIAMLVEDQSYLEYITSGDTLVKQFTDAMEEEKDPRCLLLCMRICRLILENLTVSADSVLKIFNVTVVYFPITFRPPPNDPYGITTESLVSGLTGVFSATPLMAVHVVPLLLEKLRLTSSEVTLVKIDSLKTLQACISHYGVNALIPYLDALRHSLFQHIVSPEEQSIEEEALSVVSSMSRELAKTYATFPLSSGIDQPGSPWSLFTENLLKQSAQEAEKSIDSMLGRASGRIAGAIAASSAPGLNRAMHHFIPLLDRILKKPDGNVTQKDILEGKALSPTQKTATLDLLLLLLNGISPDVDFPRGQNPISNYLDEILSMLMEIVVRKPETGESNKNLEMNIHSSRRLAVQGLEVLISRPPSPLLSDDQMQLVIRELSSGIKEVAIRSSCMSALKKAASVSPQSTKGILEETAPLLLQSVEQEMSVDEPKYQSWALTALSELCTVPDVFDSVVPKLLNLAVVESTNEFSNSPGLIRVLSALGLIVNSNRSYGAGLKNCAESTSESKSIGMIDKLLKGLSGRIDLDKTMSKSLSESCASICRTVVQNIDEETQNATSAATVKLLLSTWDEYSQSEDKYILVETIPRLSLSLGAILGSVKSVDSFSGELESISEILLRLANERQHIGPWAATACAQTVAAILNKCDNELLSSLSDKILYSGLDRQGNKTQGLLAVIEDSQRDIALRENSLYSLVWIFKALAMRSKADGLGDKFVALLHHECTSIRLIAASSFGTVIRSCEEVLNKSSFSKESFLFKQRFFKENFVKLATSLDLPQGCCGGSNGCSSKKSSSGCGSSSSTHEGSGCCKSDPVITEITPSSVLDSRTATLFALTKMLQHVPDSFILNDIEKVVPVLVMALGSKFVNVKVSALSSLWMLVNEDVESLEPHLGTIVPLLLRLVSVSQKHDTILVRAADRVRAIDCLSGIATSLPYPQIFPFKKTIGRGIMPALDDRKRAVRRKAVECKNLWLTLQH
eukprot:CAMPEP_0184023124 /NCGR_PEP_ID=MMETSP0954-20121128/11123_1 /TAXON_ID=627963 /ORGANISM="Aplanochytrium sp, Strain PBS07" /LENGTH=1147 /DNA_ID=CAMNT_0026305847 /DNA_START=93 /DNA_END=3536 /DNA_ORIENTATION=-